MGLLRAAYRNFTSTMMNNRFSATCDHSVSGSNVDCTNVTTTKINSIVGLTDRAWSTMAADTSANRWSAWGPTQRSVSGGVLTNAAHSSSNFSIGSYAGYNHSAPTPGFTSGGSNTSVWISGGSVTFTCVMDIGEVRYENDVAGVTPTHVHFSVWDGANWVTNASAVIALSSATSGAGNSNSILDFSQSGTRITLTGLTATKDYTCKVWFSTSSTFYYDGTNRAFTMSQFPNWVVTAKYKSDNHFIVAGPSSAQTPDGSGSWTDGNGYWRVNNLQINLSAGTVTMYALDLAQPLGGYWGHTSYDRLDLRFKVESGYYNQSGTWVGTLESTSSYYTTNEPWNQSNYAVQITSAFDIWTPSGGMDTSGYGYRIIVDCNCY